MSSSIKKIALNIADMVAGTQETMLVLRHGSVPEENSVYGDLRRKIYRGVSDTLSLRELTFELSVQYRDILCTLKPHRLYHQQGYIYRVSYLPATSKAFFKDNKAADRDIAISQISAWAAANYYATAPRGCRLLYHRLAETDGFSTTVAESKLVELPLFDPEKVIAYVQKKLGAISDSWDLPDSDLEECTATQRFALDSDAYCKCRTSCRSRKVCAQYGKVLESGSQEFTCAEHTIDNLRRQPENVF